MENSEETKNSENTTNLSENEVYVDVEYCGYCNFKLQCLELAEAIHKTVPDAQIYCRRGRQGAFEVKINDILVHSKIATLAFPEYKDVAENVRNALEGKEMKTVSQQPIRDCRIM